MCLSLKQPNQPFYCHYAGQHVLASIPVKNWIILLQQFYSMYALAEGN